MRTFIKHTIAMALVSGLFFLPACKKETPGGSAVVQMTEPEQGRFNEATVEILKVELHYENTKHGNNGWVYLQTNAANYYLMSEKRASVATVAIGEDVPAGRIDKVRITFGSHNKLRIGAEEYTIYVPEQISDGLNIDVNGQIQSYNKLKLLLNWDASASIRTVANKGYELWPVITVEQSYIN